MADLISNASLKEIIEATLFVSGEGVPMSAFCDKLEVSQKDVEKAVSELKKKLNGDNGIHLVQYRDKIQLASNPNYANEISSVLNPIRERALTKAALETMSIIAYKQPVTRLEIEEIRGVSCDYTVQVLMDHNLIEVIGRKDVIGKPLLFGTTDEFLKRFQLESLEQLPNQEDLLERIKLIHGEDDKSDSLYYDFKLPDEEEIPEFLQGEEGVVSLTGSDSDEGLPTPNDNEDDDDENVEDSEDEDYDDGFYEEDDDEDEDDEDDDE